MLDLGARLDLEIPCQAGAELAIASGRERTLALGQMQPHQRRVHALAVGIDREIALGTGLGFRHLAAPQPEREQVPEGRSGQIAQALPLGQEPVLVLAAEIADIRQEIAAVQIAGCGERLERPFRRESLEAHDINGHAIRVEPD